MLEVLYQLAKFVGAWISPVAAAAENVDFLFVCLFVTLLNLKVCAPILPRMRWSTETILMPLDIG